MKRSSAGPEPTTAAIPHGLQGEATSAGYGFGTFPVFLASASTILGAVLFLRFGYAVAHVGVLGALVIIVLGHLVTVPTALAVAEIATNRRVEGGGEYFIISRSFGTTIGAAIGISLYMSQALSTAFYLIAFAEAFRSLQSWFESTVGIAFDPRMVSIPATVGLAALVLTRGATLGVKALWVVAGLLGVALAFFFLGGAPAGTTPSPLSLFDRVADPDPFILVFAIVFPAFTGMTAGVGLSGDLENPRRAIPLGTLSATLVGMVVYVLVVLKLAASTTPEMLAGEQLVMAKIAIWGPIIPLGLACATVSSAIGSFLVAPRTLQALASDRVLPPAGTSRFLARGGGDTNEPRNATLVTAAFALVTVAMGDVDFVARLISMFFMVTYGALCTISLLEHFAARPSYRPSFRSKWWLSLLGAIACLLLMFQMDPLYAILALFVMTGIYLVIRATSGGQDDLAAIFKGVMRQTTRHFQIRLQKGSPLRQSEDWRPSIIMVNGRTFTRNAPLELFTWLCHRYGFGTYLHYVEGQLDRHTYREARKLLVRLVETIQRRKSALYVDTMVSPSFRTALAQSLQVPGVSGMENNAILFEASIHDDATVYEEIREGCLMAETVRMSSLVLRHGDCFFGSHSTIHVWLTWHDYKNAHLLVLLAYILLGHPDWYAAEIRIFAAFPQEEASEEEARLREMVTTGRLPISRKNLRVFATHAGNDFSRLVEAVSSTADLVIFGFTEDRLRDKGVELFERHAGLRDVLFVSANESIAIE